MQIQMIKAHIDSYAQQLRTWADTDHREAGMGTIEMAILVTALIALAVALVALLWAAFNSRSAGIN